MNQLTTEEKEIVLKVASLIEQGSAGKVQITGHYFGDDDEHCCALGAMYHAIGIHTHLDLTFETSKEKLGIVTWPRIEYPIVEEKPYADLGNKSSLQDVVIFLNDRLHWSFSKIVDYLRDATVDKATTTKVKHQKL